MTTATHQVESNESAFSEVLVDMPDALMTAAQIEAKRLGVSLEQWVAQVVSQALTAELHADENASSSSRAKN